jgi:hypothetical protein
MKIRRFGPYCNEVFRIQWSCDFKVRACVCVCVVSSEYKAVLYTE